MTAMRQLCTFQVGGLLLGVEALQVQEVVRLRDLTPVPRARPVIRGLMNLRGQIVLVIDLGRCLGLAETDAGQAMQVVLRTDEGLVSLLVDQIGDVIEAPEGDFERPPDTIRASGRHLIRGAYKLKDSLLLELDAGRALGLASGGGPDESGGARNHETAKDCNTPVSDHRPERAVRRDRGRPVGPPDRPDQR